ncbi:MAG: hypothetical protein GY799_02610 [Desulfobulbaceae bacterium]|nr:hypothetical protein [Desulfobulbaceae bacterium]
MSDLKNIYQRMNAVMLEVEYVKKDKAVTGGGQNYKAVTHDQVVSVARSALVKHGVLIVPNQIEGRFLVMRDMNATPNPVKMGLYSGWYEINFINIDDGSDKITVKIEAHAADNGDKATGKALTYATKAAILKVLSLETGENDESREELRDTSMIDESTAQELQQQMTEAGPDGQMVWSKKGQRLLAKYKLGTLGQLKESKLKAFRQDLAK